MSYQDDIKSYLINNYQVKPVLVTKSKHKFYEFDYNGKQYRIILNINNSGGTSNAYDMKCQDIRRILGKPPIINVKQSSRRSLKEMTLELDQYSTNSTGETQMKLGDTLPEMVVDELSKIETKPNLEQVKVACYLKDKVRFIFPNEVVSKYFGMGSGEIEYHNNCWIITPNLNLKQPKFSNYGTNCKAVEFFVEGSTIFGLSRTDTIYVDGKFLITCEKREEVITKKNKKREEATTNTITPLIKNLSDQKNSDISNFKQRALFVLSEIKALEGINTHKLIRFSSGRLQWKPIGEIIELPEE